MKEKYKLPELPERGAVAVMIDIGQWLANSFGATAVNRRSGDDGEEETTWGMVHGEIFVRSVVSDGEVLGYSMCVRKGWQYAHMIFYLDSDGTVGFDSGHCRGDQGYRWLGVLRSEYVKRARRRMDNGEQNEMDYWRDN